MYAASKDLYIMQIHVNSGYESDGLSSVAMLICMCLKLISTFFGLYVEKFCYHALSCLYEYFLISYSVSQTTLLPFDNSFVFMWLKVVANACTVSFNRNLTLDCWSLEFVSLKKTAFFLEESWNFALKLYDHPAWSNTFLAKVWVSQGTCVPKSQGVLLKNWVETLTVISFCNFGMNFHV